jgi:hypothetical protein
VVTIDEVRAFALTLPGSSEAIVRGRVKFRIGRIVYLSFSRDGTVMGFAFPKEWRDALVEAEPEKFSLPGQSDLPYHWVHVRLSSLSAAGRGLPRQPVRDRPRHAHVAGPRVPAARPPV